MNAVFYFVLATIIGTSGIAYLIVHATRAIIEDVGQKPRIMTKMFLKVAAVEIIPILFIVIGYMKLQNGNTGFGGVVYPAVMGGLITLLHCSWIFANYKVLTYKMEKGTEMKKILFDTMMMGYGLLLAVPIVSYVGIAMS